MIDNLIALALSTTIIGLVMGIVYQTVSRAADQRKYPPSGQLIDIGGFRLHFNCAGQGRPTVVMDAGGGAPSISWGLVGAFCITPRKGAFHIKTFKTRIEQECACCGVKPLIAASLGFT